MRKKVSDGRETSSVFVSRVKIYFVVATHSIPS